MRFFMILAIAAGLVGPAATIRSNGFALQANEEQKPKVSQSPLTAEEIAVYRAVLKGYVKNSERSLNLADTTYPLGSSGAFGPDDRCLNGVKLEPADKSAIAVHRLDPAVALSAK